MNFYKSQSLLDEILHLDPDILEAEEKLRVLKGRPKPVHPKGSLDIDLISVVSALPFDYQAMNSGGNEYIIDRGEKNRRSIG